MDKENASTHDLARLFVHDLAYTEYICIDLEASASCLVVEVVDIRCELGWYYEVIWRVREALTKSIPFFETFVFVVDTIFEILAVKLRLIVDRVKVSEQEMLVYQTPNFIR